MIEKQIQTDTLNSMKNSDKFKVSALRMLKSAIQSEAINKKKTLDDDEIIMVIRKQVKLREASVLEYEKYNRSLEVENLKKEIAILNNYLPKELSKDEINKELDAIFAKLNPTSIKDMGLIMKEATKIFGSRVDMAKVSQMIKERLTK